GQNFDALPTNEEVVSFLRELGHTRRSILSMMLLLIICINRGGLLLVSLTKVSLERQLKNMDYVELLWEDFIYQIDNKAYKKKEKIKSKRVKRPAKKSTETPARGVVIKATLEMPLTKKKEKIDVTHDDSNNEQVSSDKDSDQEKDSDHDKTQSDNEHESNSEHETDESEVGSKFDHDESEENEEYDDDEDKTKNTDDSEGDKDEEIDYTTIRTDEGFVQEDGNDAKTEVPVTSSSHSSDLATKFLNFLDIPHTNSEIVSPFDVHVHHEVPSQQTPTLLTVPVSVISDYLPVFSTVIPQSLPSSTPLPQ
nr:hypothetical protein [Tanacetum cinerariifolium]